MLYSTLSQEGKCESLQPMDLAVVILNWNAAADTVRCVREITAWERLEPIVLIVDNASTDNSISVITHQCPEARLVRNSVNLGFGGGNNRGIVESLSLGDAPILLLNNDASISENDVVRLLRSLKENDQVGFIAPLLFSDDKRDTLLAAGARNPAFHHHSHIREVPADGPVQIVDCVPGTVVLGRAEVFRQVGLLDESYFYGSEVVDLCLRARRAGYLSAIDARAQAYHDLDRSSAFRETLYPYYIVRNRFLLIRKFHHKRRLLLYGFWGLYSLALSAKERLEGNSPAARAIRLGLIDGLRGKFGNHNERVLAIASAVPH